MSSELAFARNGFFVYELESYERFISLVKDEEIFRSDTYVYRGERDGAWHLVPSLTRILKSQPAELRAKLRDQHLERFALALRGRANLSDRIHDVLSSLTEQVNMPGSTAHLQRVNNSDITHREFEIWALGQHWGLATPLLDWTHFPLTALYFAFFDPDTRSKGEYRSVYLLNKHAVRKRTANLRKSKGRNNTLDLIESYSDENTRLIAQGGLFSLCSKDQPIEHWVTDNFEASGNDTPVLIKFLIPNERATTCVALLHTMGINTATMFPDKQGVVKHCNLQLALAVQNA